MNPIDARRAQAEERQQQAAHAQAPLFLRACPGAGKTRVLVDRHCRTPPGPVRSGRALLSFTNVAADELRDRCAGNRPDLISFPHFIGTFDSFLWRYLVRPFLPATPAWQHIRSWDQVRAAIVGPRKIPLSEFRFTYNPDTRHTQVEWPTPDKARTLANSTYTEADYVRFARQRRDVLWQTRGYMTGHETRVAALDHVRNPTITKLLRDRFTEIVVDEAQDCSTLDLAILKHLHQAGLPLVIVADTDQGIYEWNDARPQELLTFTVHLANHLELNGNWRSSPPVCQLAATLRPATRSLADDPVGKHHDTQTPVLLLPYGRHRKKASGLTDIADASDVLVRHAERKGITADNCMALAYNNNAIPKAHSRPALHPPKGAGSGIKLAWAAAVFAATETPPAARQHALTIASTLLSDYWHPDAEGSLTEILAAHAIEPALLSRRAARFLAALPPVDQTPARVWRSEALAVLKAQSPPSGTAPARPKALKLANKELDEPIAALAHVPHGDHEDAPAAAMRGSSIHRAKGKEADAVLVHLPTSQAVSELLQAWADPQLHTGNSELLRTYYVALTRARRLLALTYPYSKHQDVLAHLDAMEIEYRSETGPLTV
ncbi:UvrD-helicase domain-containing protein [Streptomyces sp. NPDC052114]|uniref:UvrD-helicase domain-containing protein n=1 Tax=unclassified Streptomyces TaxID=2593676 RepID=UPI00343F7C4B